MLTLPTTVASAPAPNRLRSTSKSRLLGLAALAAAAATGLSACGSTTTTAAPTTTTAGSGRLAAFDTCMEGKGIPASALTFRRRPFNGAPPSTTPGQTFPSNPGGGGGYGGGFGGAPPSLPAGVSQSQYTAAMQACRSKLPAGGFGSFGSAAGRAWINCLTVHGYTPTFGVGTGSGAAGATTTTVAAATRDAAMAACASLRPSRGSGGAGGSTAGQGAG